MTETSDRSDRSAAREGPFEASPWPRTIRANVIAPEPDPRIHGYAVESDLARHYGFAETLFLSLTGELPSADVARAFDVTLTFLGPIPIHEAATHAGAVARLCNAPPRAVLETSAVALAERASFSLRPLAPLLTWLDAPEGAPPSVALTNEVSDAESVGRLRAALPKEFEVPALTRPLTRAAALVAVLHRCGFRRLEQFEAAWTIAALGAVFAEAMATRPFSFRDYPTDTPAFRYQGDP